MVYCGKPSKGCSHCRERKIRCDQKEPGCGQCIKRHIECPGYRNMVDLMFRDESHDVIKKATSAKPRIKKLKHGGRAAPKLATPQIAPPRPPSPSSAALVIRDSPRPPKALGPLMRRSKKSPLLSVLLAGPYARKDGFDEDDWVTHTYPYEYQRIVRRGRSDDDYDYDDDDDFFDLDLDGPAGDALVHIPYAPSISLQERGTAFFFSRYVATDLGCYQNYDFIYDIWKPPTMSRPRRFEIPPQAPPIKRSDALISAGMTAVGLVGLSKITGDRETMLRAQQSYGAALQLANAALRDPKEAVEDSTMLGVLILGTYEFISGRTPQTLHAWQEHINGAATLATLRGQDQFHTKAGVRMFTMLCHSVLISCIQSGLPMPKAIVDLRNELRNVADSKLPAWRVIDPLYKALQIRHDIKHRRITGMDDIIGSLVEIEDEFEMLIRGLPPSWRYQNVSLTKSNPAIMGPSCHVYPGLTQATSWNAVRTMRILVQETILEQLCYSVEDPTTLPMHHQLHLVKAMKMLRKLGEAVVGSVPQHFGIVSSRDVKYNKNKGATRPTVTAQNQPSTIVSAPLLPPAPERDDSKSPVPAWQRESATTRPTLLDPTQSELGNGRSDSERFLTLATASNTIIWPLYTLGLSSSCTHETSAYIVDRLMSIYRETGLEQARVVAGMMQNRQESLTWASIPTTRLPSLPEDALPLVV
ncbi:hypothetical protein TRIATDRAFT_279683 [Trichoderma atroviride IMI 206040]|uniref:Zn(2)-C6 fungal-type domain-containing protein n=2 Tax=Hypocrea atroviridis TaxID=63577 RepID=G9NEC1_HYPAI|nr:uncharacterized protein TRIATDRAFT_279683 [Trichoderma atroviride IMI 206040]EHK51027.1 hypothetical protein TRIATDRAFT_279683 [Trichoderma atroviride IMI 206040]